jgi:uncharacterized small protein (DUF1192 family)
MFSVNTDAILFDLSPQASKTQTLVLTNTSSYRIAYKVKTNASKAYSVKPTQGYLSPNESTTISIILQLSDSSSEVKHKFMILGTNASICENLEQWGTVPKEKIYDILLDVKFGLGKTGIIEALKKKTSSPDNKKALADNKNYLDDFSVDELNNKIKALEAEKKKLEAKLSEINYDLRVNEANPRKKETVMFKRNSLIVFGVAGLVYGYFYS